MNEFVKENPLAFEFLTSLIVLLYPKVKKGITNILKKLENNLHYYPYFVQGLTFKNEYTLDSFTKSLQLEDIREINTEKTYFKMVNAFLIVYGYKYDYQNDKWVK